MPIYTSATGIRYGVAFHNRIPVVFLDYHHNNSSSPYPDANFTTYAFKSGDPHSVAQLAPLVASIAAENFANFSRSVFTHVAPVLGRNDLVANPASATYQLAAEVAKAMRLQLDAKSCGQSRGRDSLHGGQVLNREKREAVLNDVVQVKGNLNGRCYVLVDDVYTTGATIGTYEHFIRNAGGQVRGVVVLMRHANDQQLLNPQLYAPIASFIRRRLQSA